jgi:hypothetical protein
MDGRSPRRHAGMIVGVTAGAGLVAGAAAATGTGPFAGLAASPLGLASQHQTATPAAAPLDASSLFKAPSAPLVHSKVDVYDQVPQAPAPPKAAPRPSSAQRPPVLSSTPSHSGGDDSGGGHGGGGGDD